MTNSFLSSKPVKGDLALVFPIHSAQTSMATNLWAVGREAAEWFVPTMSGNLSEIKLAVEPDGGSPHPAKQPFSHEG